MDQWDFNKLAKLMDIGHLRHLVLEAMKWSNSSPAITAFRDRFVDLALTYAISAREASVVQDFLKKGVTGNIGHILEAFNTEQVSIMDALLELGATVTNDGVNEALRSSLCNVDMFRRLLEKDPDLAELHLGLYFRSNVNLPFLRELLLFMDEKSYISKWLETGAQAKAILDICERTMDDLSSNLVEEIIRLLSKNLLGRAGIVQYLEELTASNQTKFSRFEEDEFGGGEESDSEGEERNSEASYHQLGGRHLDFRSLGGDIYGYQPDRI